MKEGIMRIIGYLRGVTKIWMLVVAIIISLIVGYMARGVFGTTSNESGVSIQQMAHENEIVPEWWTCSMHPHIKLPKPGTNPRGVEINKEALSRLVGDKETKVIEISWQKSDVEYKPYQRWVDYWSEE